LLSRLAAHHVGDVLLYAAPTLALGTHAQKGSYPIAKVRSSTQCEMETPSPIYDLAAASRSLSRTKTELATASHRIDREEETDFLTARLAAVLEMEVAPGG